MSEELGPLRSCHSSGKLAEVLGSVQTLGKEVVSTVCLKPPQRPQEHTWHWWLPSGPIGN